MKKTVAFARNTTNLFFHILTRCNLRCRHCYIDPAQHGAATLSIDTITHWLRLFVNASGKSANVIFLGGEPTLHPDLATAVKAARELGYASVTVDTNGYLFHDILDRVTPEEVDFFSFSLDGASAATNDALRGQGCFVRCVDGLHRAKAKGFATSLIYTVSSANIDDLALMPPLLAGLAPDRFFIQVIGLRGASATTSRGAEAAALQVPRSQWQAVIPTVANAVAAAGIPVVYPKVYLDPQEPFACAAKVADNAFVFPNGRIYRCPLCEDFPIHSRQIVDGKIQGRAPINEDDLFKLTIPEGCVMNRIIQPANIGYAADGRPLDRIACCLLKEEVL